MLSRMLSWLIARSLPQPSLVLDDFNALHLLHMHPHTKACCRPWLDSAASGGEAECWQNLAPRNRKQNQTLYYADFRGYLSLEQSIGEDAKAYRHALGSQVILVAMSSHFICEARFKREYRSWMSALPAQRVSGCVAWLTHRASSHVDAADRRGFCAASSFTGQGSASLAARVARAAAKHGLTLLDAFNMSAHACPAQTHDGRHYPGLVPLEAARLHEFAATAETACSPSPAKHLNKRRRQTVDARVNPTNDESEPACSSSVGDHRGRRLLCELSRNGAADVRRWRPVSDWPVPARLLDALRSW